MPNYLHRTTKTYLHSVPENELPEPVANYIYMPDLSAVEGIPIEYWKIVGDTVSEMNQTEKDAVDTQLLSDSRDELIQDQIDYIESVLRQVVDLTIKEINLLRQWIMDYKSEVAAATSLADLKSRIAAMDDMLDRTFAQFKTQLRNGLGS